MGDCLWCQYRCGGLGFGGLKFVNVIFGVVREPDRTSVGGNGLEKDVLSGKEILFLVAPIGACQTFSKLYYLL